MFIAILKTPGTQTAHIVFLYEPEVDAQNSPDIATTLSTYVSPSVMRSSKADPERLRVGKPLKRKQSDRVRPVHRKQTLSLANSRPLTAG